MATPYLALRELLAQPPYDKLDDKAAAEALNAATEASAGSVMVSPDEFVDRFTAEEFAAAVDSADKLVRKLIFRLRVRQEPLSLGSDTVKMGLAYMASIGMLTKERAADIGAVPPGPLVSPREQIGWPGPTIWPADIAAARKM